MSKVCKKGALVLKEEKGEDEELRGRERREVGGSVPRDFSVARGGGGTDLVSARRRRKLGFVLAGGSPEPRIACQSTGRMKKFRLF